MLAETWFCAATLAVYNKPDEVESKVYKREGSGFTRTTTISGEAKMDILNENAKFVALAETYNYPSVFITFLYKDTSAFYEKYIDTKGWLACRDSGYYTPLYKTQSTISSAFAFFNI